MKPLRECKCGTAAHSLEDLELFSKNPACKYGRSHECKKCYSKRKRKWAKDNPLKTKEKEIKRNYGISLAEYDMLMSRTDVCEICGEDTGLVFDHDHSLKGIESFRGALCDRCNRGLGFFNDTLETIEKAHQYMMRYYQE